MNALRQLSLRACPKRAAAGPFVCLALMASLMLPASAAAEIVPSANGKILFAQDGHLQLMDPDGPGRVALLPEFSAADPAWSHDGEWIAFAGAPTDGGQQGIYVVRPDGSGLRYVGEGGDPTWAPAGRRLAVVRPAPEGLEIYVVRLDGSRIHRITDLPGSSTEPSWSPDGGLIAFTHVEPAGGDTLEPRSVWIVDPRPSHPRELVPADIADDRTEIAYGPTWSPEGTHVVFRRRIDAGSLDAGLCDVPLISNRIEAIRPDGSDPAVLSGSGEPHAVNPDASSLPGPASLSPDGRWLIEDAPAVWGASQCHGGEYRAIYVSPVDPDVPAPDNSLWNDSDTNLSDPAWQPRPGATDATAYPPATSVYNGSARLPLPADWKPRYVFWGGPLSVRWAVKELGSGIDGYGVRYRKAGPRENFSDPVPWLEGNTSGGDEFDPEPGNTYCFSSRMTDLAGNLSGWSDEACGAVPLDDHALEARAGDWALGEGESNYEGTYSETSRRGATLRLADVRARTIFLLARVCPDCGSMNVLWDGQLLRRVDLQGRRRHAEHRFDVVTLRLGSFADVQEGTLRIVVTSSGQPVLVDGLILSRV